MGSKKHYRVDSIFVGITVPCYWVNKHLFIKSVLKNNHVHVYNCGTKYPENQDSERAIPCFNNLIGNSDNKRDLFNRLSATNLDTYSIRFRDKVRCFSSSFFVVCIY